MKRLALVLCVLFPFSPFGGASHGEADGAVQAAIARIEGQWVVESAESDGVNVTNPEVEKLLGSWATIRKQKYIVKGDRLSILGENGDKVLGEDFAIRIDLKTSPKSIDVILNKEVIARGIIAIDNDIAIVSIQKNRAKARPKSFNSAAEGSGVIVYIFRRVRK